MLKRQSKSIGFGLNQSGLAHLLYPILGLAVIAVIASAGFYVYQQNKSGAGASRATVPANGQCRKGQTLINANARDIITGSYKSAARAAIKKNKNGLICVTKKGSARVSVRGVNDDTIIAWYYCNKDQTFAFDKKNTDGTGYHSKAFVQSKKGGNYGDVARNATKTYYCIPKSKLSTFGNSRPKGFKADGSPYPNVPHDIYGHKYIFYPYYDLGEFNGLRVFNSGANWYCMGGTLMARNTGCSSQYFFSYKNDGDIPNPK